MRREGTDRQTWAAMAMVMVEFNAVAGKEQITSQAQTLCDDSISPC